MGYFCDHGIRRAIRNPWHDRRCAHFCGIYAAIKAVVNTFLRKKDLPVETVKYSYLKNIDEEGFHQLDSRLQRDHEIKDQVDFEQDKKDQEEKNVGEK